MIINPPNLPKDTNKVMDGIMIYLPVDKQKREVRQCNLTLIHSVVYCGTYALCDPVINNIL